MPRSAANSGYRTAGPASRRVCASSLDDVAATSRRVARPARLAAYSAAVVPAECYLPPDGCGTGGGGSAGRPARPRGSTAIEISPRARADTSGGAWIVLPGTKPAQCRPAMPGRPETSPSASPSAPRRCGCRRRPARAGSFRFPCISS
jgi:hypothetical protein